MRALFYPSYFPNIWSAAAMVQADELLFEKFGTYQKQTYRNRTLIYGANGIQLLTIPVNYSQKNRQMFSEVKISKDYAWQQNHWKSLQSAYNTSAFFEFYKDEFEKFYSVEYDKIIDLCIASIALVFNCLGHELNWSWTTNFDSVSSDKDVRKLIMPAVEDLPQHESYFQLFSTKHGFQSNLSTLDLIFNEGPNALPFLLRQKIDLI
ncbi:MAG: WbqC family protein [Bacteroidia bacterium]|nr:WbqC family protein [Bacteroidia bacterium]